jgi:NAD(P)-dependent dehydrogenase (short-subunit alcohol dehydrogenase family)
MTNSELSESTVVITGGSSGIGAALVDFYLARGSRVFSLDLNPSGSRASEIDCDVRDANSVSSAMAKVRNDSARIDVLIANAGVVPSWQSTENLDLADFTRVMEINLIGVAATLKYAAPAMRSPGGSIVITGSINSWKGDPNLASYVASKHGVLGLIKSAALDLGPKGIRVNGVGPGPVATDALRNRILSRNENDHDKADAYFERLAQGTALKRIATVEEVIHAIDFLASPLSSGITGELINVDGGVL